MMQTKNDGARFGHGYLRVDGWVALRPGSTRRNLAVWLWLAVLAMLVALALSTPAAAEGILSVLVRSNRQKLDELTRQAVSDPRADLLRNDFERLLARQSKRPDVELLVVDGPVQAETLAGRVIVISAGLAVLDEGERLFILAHELGHVQMAHWTELSALYVRHIPAEVTPDVTDAVAPVLGREASALVHGHEYAADAFAWRSIRAMGYGLASARGALQVVPNLGDSSTHPATRKRMAQLRMIGDAESRSAGLKAD
jgi:Zn-dependent protease with chaperone function